MRVKRFSPFLFLVILLVLGLFPQTIFSQHYAEKKAWYIDNWPDSVLSWEIYRTSFIGIPPTRDPYSSGFDVLFYDLAFKSEISKKGNCFGMSVMSLLMLSKGGYYGFCLPIPQYSGDLYSDLGPSDPNLRKAINAIHGHQLSLPALKFMLDIIARGKQRDGIYAYNQFLYYKSKDDPTVISVTKSTSPADGGHTMVAYDAKIVDGYRRIYLYDPNRSWADPAKRTWYTSGKNYITIDSTASHGWTFHHGTDWWSGDPGGGGNIMIFPLSIVGPTARSPMSLGLSVSDILAQFFVTGDNSEIEQITNAEGKRMYIPGTTDIDTNPATGLLNTMPWIPSDDAPAPQPGESSERTLVYFMLGNPRGAVDIDLRNGKTGYQLGMVGGTSYISLRAIGGAGKDLVTLEGAGTTKPGIIIRNQSNASRYEVQFTQILQPNKRSRIFRVKNLQVQPEKPVIIQVTRNQRALEINTTQTGLTYDLELVNVVQRQPTILKRKNVRVEAGHRQIIEPKNWRSLSPQMLQIRQAPVKIAPKRLQRLSKQRMIK